MSLRLALQITGDASGAKQAAQETETAVKGLGKTAELSSAQTMALNHSIRSMTEQLAMGVNPAQALTMQMSHLSFAMSGAGGLKAAAAGIAGALANPLNLATIGFGLATAAAGALISEIMGAAPDIEKHLASHAELVKRLTEYYRGAKNAAHDYNRESLAAQINDTRRDMRQTQADLTAELSGILPGARARFLGGAEIGAAGGQLNNVIKGFSQSISQGKADVIAFREELSKIELALPNDSPLRPLIDNMLDASKTAAELQGKIAQDQDILKGLAGDSDAAARALGGVGDGATAAANAAAGALPAMSQFDALLARIGGRSPILAPQIRMNEFKDEVAKARELINTIDAPPGARSILPSLLDKYATEAEPHVNPLPKVPAVHVAAGRAPGAASGYGAARDPHANDFRQEVDSINKEIDALNIEAQTFGMSEQAAASFRREQELLQAAQRAGIAITPELKANIDELANSYGAATAKVADLKEQQQTFDELKGSAKGFTSELLHGLKDGKSLTDSLNGSLKSLSDRMLDSGLNKLFDILLGGGSGPGGGGSGGLFGNIFSSLFNSGGGPAAGGSGGGFGSILASLFNGGGAGGSAMFSGGSTPFAMGSLFAAGDVISSPARLSFTGGGHGMMAEAGPEAIMPLARLPSGALGVRAQGGQAGRSPQGGVVIHQYITTPNPKAFREDRLAAARGGQRLLSEWQRRHT